MKTAMQELIENLDSEMKSRGMLPNWDMYLEKEKEQIIDAYVKGFDISAEGWNGEYGIEDFNNIKEEIKAEQYFNQTYNQNK